MARNKEPANVWRLAAMGPQDDRPPALQIADRIREAIAAGDFRPGELVPTSAQIARRYGVSQSTAGRALTVLAREGVLRNHAGVGSFVAKVPGHA